MKLSKAGKKPPDPPQALLADGFVSLHSNLIDQLNAEIGLGTITSISSATKWLESTFLCVRLRQNPEHYGFPSSSGAKSLEEKLHDICRNGILALQECGLVRSEAQLSCTEYGDAMSRYSVRFATMKLILSLPPRLRYRTSYTFLVRLMNSKSIGSGKMRGQCTTS